MTYPTSQGGQSSSLQQSPAAMSRLRAASSAYPPSLDLRAQYRAVSNQGNPNTSRSNSFSFTGGYASAPLAAPVEFSTPRTPIDGNQPNRDFTIPQLSAPMAPPQDFSSAYTSNLSPRSRPPQQQQNDNRDYANQVQVSAQQNNRDSGAQGQGQVRGQGQSARAGNEGTNYMRPGEYEPNHARKSSYTQPGSQFESPSP